jgi:hypothetical protein
MNLEIEKVDYNNNMLCSNTYYALFKSDVLNSGIKKFSKKKKKIIPE